MLFLGLDLPVARVQPFLPGFQLAASSKAVENELGSLINPSRQCSLLPTLLFVGGYGVQDCAERIGRLLCVPILRAEKCQLDQVVLESLVDYAS